MVQAVIATTVTGLQGRGVANTAPTNNQALTWNGSAWAPAGPFLTAAGAPYIPQNYVDNSGFTVNQRGYASGAALPAGTYGFDRWKAGASGCTLTFTNSPALTVVTIAAGTLQQVVEGVSLMNASYTLSWVGSATGRVNTGTYVASPITFTGAPNTNVTIEFQGGTLSQVQLQIGTQATLWQPVPPQVETARCMRFFYAISSIEGGYSSVAAPATLTTHTFPVLMRAAPSLTISNLTLAGVATALVLSSATVQGWTMQITTNAANIYFGQAILSFSADL